MALFCSTLKYEIGISDHFKTTRDAGTSIGVNYGAACRSKSKADLINELSIVEEKMDKSKYWLELRVGLYRKVLNLFV